MATRSTVVANGTAFIFSVPFPYQARSDVKVTLNGVLLADTEYTWATSSSISLNTVPASGVKVTIYRETPSGPRTIYQSGSVLTRDQLEVDSLQALYRTEEAAEQTLRLSGDDTANPVLPPLVPLSALVVNPEGTGIEMGDTDITGDMLLRGELANPAAGKGSKLVAFLQAGVGAIARWVEDKLRERVSVEDFGAVGDGVADDTAAFLAARDYAASIGGADIFLNKFKYKITSTITVSQPNIKFRGRAGWINHDVGTPVPGTWIDWQGATGGTVFAFIPVEGASNQRGTNGGLVDVGLFGNNVADNGLVVKSWTNGEFRVYGANFNRTIVEVGVVATLGEARDAQFNNFWIYGRQVTSPVSPSTLIIGGSDNGTNTANTSFNRFNEISTNYKDGVALDLYDSDSNWFGLVRLNSGGGTGKGMVWRGGTGVTGANKDAARGNYFQMVSVGAGGFTAKGTPEFASASSGAIAWYDKGNAAPDPVIDTGALVAWSDGGFVHSGPAAFVRMAIASTRAGAIAQRDVMGTETVRIHSPSSNHVVLTDGTINWGVNVSGGSLRFTRSSGTGFIDFTNLEVQSARLRLKNPAIAVGAGEVCLGNGTATTVGAAGGAAALPAAPVGYLSINVAGTFYKIPYYNS